LTLCPYTWELGCICINYFLLMTHSMNRRRRPPSNTKRYTNELWTRTKLCETKSNFQHTVQPKDFRVVICWNRTFTKSSIRSTQNTIWYHLREILGRHLYTQTFQFKSNFPNATRGESCNNNRWIMLQQPVTYARNSLSTYAHNWGVLLLLLLLLNCELKIKINVYYFPCWLLYTNYLQS